MDPMTYAALLPGLLARRPKESQDTQAGRAGLMDAGAAYRGLQSSFKRQADTYAGKFDQASNQYLDTLSRPVGSDAEDMAIIGRAKESNQMGATRAKARIANNPATLGGSGQAGAASSLEHRRLAGDAALSARVADMNLQQRRQRQQQIVDFLSRQLARNQSGYAGALGSSTGISQSLLSLGRGTDARNQASSQAGLQGIMQILAQLGQGQGDTGGM